MNASYPAVAQDRVILDNMSRATCDSHARRRNVTRTRQTASRPARGTARVNLTVPAQGCRLPPGDRERARSSEIPYGIAQQVVERTDITARIAVAVVSLFDRRDGVVEGATKVARGDQGI